MNVYGNVTVASVITLNLCSLQEAQLWIVKVCQASWSKT